MNRFPAYDVTMSETHHIHKLDAPSGTAITLAEGILDNLDRKSRWVKGTLQAPDGTVSGSVECAADELPVSSIREGEVPGIHSIRYIQRQTASPLPMMPRPAAALLWELCWQQNIQPANKVS
jgi:4-hydroxy-tetrahydrodipicolinate reductase